MVIADLVDTLSRIGAIGGILSIIGVGLLILLVASQSRQIRSMREWIDEEPQRQQETAQRVIAEVQRRIAAARERRTGVPEPAAAAGAAGARSLPAAPGTLGATPEAKKVTAGKELVPPGAAPTEVVPTVPPTPGGPDAPKFAPLTPAGGAEAPADGSIPPPPADDEPAVVSEFLGQETQAADVLPDQELPATNRAESRYGDDQFDLEGDEPQGGSRALFIGGVVALLAGIVIAIFVLTSGGGDEPTTNGSASSGDTDTGSGSSSSDEDPEPSTPADTPTVDRASITVRVLNGTSVSGLAQRVTDDLKGKGYGPDRPDTFSGAQTVTETAVAYRQGKKSAAEAVAADLDLPSSAVRAIDADLSVAAGPTAEVVVLTGTDLDDSSTSGTTGE